MKRQAMGALLQLLIIPFLLVAVDGADSLAKLSDEAIANPAEVKAYWGATLPNTPMPQAILDMLALQEDGKSEKEQGPKVDGDGSKLGKFFFYNHNQQVDGDSKMGRFPLYNQGAQVDGDGSKLGKFFFYNHDQQVDGDDSKMGRFLLYNQGAQVDGDGSKLGKFFFYNHDQQVDGDDSKMGRFLLYNQGAQVDGDGSKLGKFFFYNHDQQVDGDDSKMGRFLLYNQGAQVDGDGSKLGKFFFYNHDQQVDGDDSKMGRFPLYNQGAQGDKDGSKLGKFFFYNHDQQVDGDDSKMGKFPFYNQGAQVDGDGSKLGKFFFYNHDQQVDGDDSKMGRFLLYNQGAQVDGDGSKLGKFFFYNHDQQVDGDDSKMGRFPLYNQGAQVDEDGSKLEKFFFYNHDQQVDRDDSKMTHVHGHNGAHKIDGSQKEGVEHKHIHSHGHNHVRLPKAAEDLFFFENSLATGSTRSTLIPSTRINPPFLRHEALKHIPFSPRNITSIIDMFAPASLTMIDDISFALHQCENPEQATTGEKSGCAASIESYLEFIVSTLGTSQVRAFSADVPKEGIVSQRYTTASVRLLTHSQSVLVCHDMPYPYKVLYCHMSFPTRAYQVKLISEAHGSSMDALAVCHLNTSSWNPEHAFFKLMHVKPGQTTACHYLNRGSMVWVATAKLGDKQAAAATQ
ncbi:hypothetical protein PVAP13_6NG145100 [Panicum virgatum]|uniref:BURP domain-containing protein n=1 Tax=Panicum virgatum TaxID=38727 RepID=A0A8T0R083_PANVG|nr:hypothetical protein PVAP13_6NG145100 [Panicum virgatum]